MRIRKSLILLSSLLVMLPAITIGTWTYRQSINSQFDEVQERHLLIAKNLSIALERYYKDTKLIFDSLSKDLSRDIIQESSKSVLSEINFSDISLVDEKTGKIIHCLSPGEYKPQNFMSLKILKTAASIAQDGKTTFSNVIAAPDGTNVILVVRRYGSKLAIGKLKTDYFIKTMKSVSFGDKGHAAIIDAGGNLLAHPRDRWTVERKNISKLPVAKRMMNKETGTQIFHSPALKADVIAGFTFVNGPGWGVMIPQPVSELYEKSAEIWKKSMWVVVISTAVAILFAIWLSINSTRPLIQLISAKRKISKSSSKDILEIPTGFGIPYEIKELFTSHNQMISQMHARHADIMRMAYSDLVTGLPSREAFNQIVANEFENAKTGENEFLLIFIDLDDFKAVNDTMGHEAGDIVLSIVAKQLSDSITNYTGLDVIRQSVDDNGHLIQRLKGNALISRIGGDEFVALIPWTEGTQGVDEFLHSINLTIASPFTISDRELSIKTSIGSATYGIDGNRIDELTKKADIAMYQAKQSGKNCARPYDSSAGDQSLAEIQQEVASAIIAEEMVLYYQPKIDTRSGIADCVEALVRWEHPEKGIVSPGLFIPAIVNSDVADRMGEWVIRAACKQIKEWRSVGNHTKISINIANHHLVSEQFMPSLLRIVDEIGIDPQHLEIEMTEETAMKSHQRAKSVIRALKENGFSVSLDDYGKGYSNLARLADLEIDIIKLDMSLVSQIAEDPRRSIIVSSALEMARQLDCKTVAEGIETKEQAACLAQMGCDYLQGYLFAKPMPIAQLNIWFLKNLAAVSNSHKRKTREITPIVNPVADNDLLKLTG